jgi:5-methylcytosine-specific restriction endonuclease McrA
MTDAMNLSKLDAILAKARTESDQRDRGYRERALKMYPWVCGRCARGFDRSNLTQLTVHHRNHNHDDNPEDGSNWELLCVYCHDNEHQRLLEAGVSLSGTSQVETGQSAPKNNAFAGLDALFKTKR